MDWRVHYANHRITPDLLDDYLWLQKSYEQAQAKFKRTTPPIRRLQKLIKDHCVPARVSSWRFLENVWVWEDSVVFELERAWWADVPGSDNWLAYLRRMYVVDAKRNAGLGTQFLRTLQGWCEDAGIALSLVSVLFGFSRSELDNGAFYLSTTAEVLNLWESGKIRPDHTREWLRQWYLARGFTQANLLDDDFFSFCRELSELDQFIYLPTSLCFETRRRALHRIRFLPQKSSTHDA